MVVDGAMGFHRGVREVFGRAAVIQRCRWHKRENVLKYLPESKRPAMWRKLQAAWQQPTYEQAKAALSFATTNVIEPEHCGSGPARYQRTESALAPAAG